jgi:KUP system potassium uptake protein
MAYSVASILYIPFLLLSVAATVIASQAMISGMFSVVYQGITTRLFPMFKVDYTSHRHRSQIYIGYVNWALLFAVLFIMFEFRESGRLANAYGLAVTGTMTITAVMMTWIFFLRRNTGKMLLSFFVGLVSLVFLVSCLGKIPEGGYWSLVIAFVPFALIMLYTRGQKNLYEALRPISVGSFVEKYKASRRAGGRIRGTAVYFARDARKIPSYIASVMFVNNIIYENNIIVTLATRDDPFGVNASFTDLARGLKVFEISMGYMQVIDVEKIMAAAGIEEDVLFYGIEDISTQNPFWRIFSVLKKVTPAFVQFYKLPPEKLHGVVMRVEM